MTAPDPAPTIETLLARRAWVRGIARSLVADESRVDDVEQETWIAAMENPPTRSGSIGAWLRRVIRSRAVDAHRSESRRAAREVASSRPEGTPSTESLVAKAEVQRDVAAAVCALDEPYRTTVLLRYFEEMEPREIAARLGVPVETVRTRLKRAHEKLRAKLDGEYGDRRAWCVLLLPLTKGRSPVPIGAVTGGALLMAGTKKVLAVAAAVVVLAAGTWWAAENVTAPSRGPHAPETANVPATAPSRAKVVAPEKADVPDVAGGASVAVDVVDTSGRAVAGERVELATAESRRLLPRQPDWFLRIADEAPVTKSLSASTAVDGHADVTGLAPGNWTLRVAAASYAEHEETIAVGDGASRRRVVLVPGCALSGTVFRADGTPAGGATVFADDRRTTADARGGYRLESLRPGVRQIFAGVAGGVLQEVAAVGVPDVTRLDLRLRGGCAFAGRVVDDETGAPIGGARVLVCGSVLVDLPRMQRYGAWTESADDGVYSLTDLPPGSPYLLRATRDGYVPNQRGYEFAPPNFHLAPGLHPSVEVRMRRGSFVSGRVLDERGAPVGGAAVDVLTFAGGNSIDVSEPCATAASGAFRIRAACGRAMLRVRANGFRQPDFPADPWTAIRVNAIPPSCAVNVGGATESVVDVVVVRASALEGALAGTVRREDGGSLADVLLDVSLQSNWGAGAVTGAIDANGAFRLDGLVPGTYALRASAAGCAPVRIDSLDVPAGGARDGVLVVLPRELTISGRVTDPAGGPVGGAELSAAPGTESGPASAVSREDGAFTIGRLAAGDWTVTARAPGRVAARTRVAAGTADLEIRLEPAMSIAGVVVDAAGGDPVPGVVVQAQLSTYRSGFPLYREVASDASGRFVLEGLSSDTYRLWAGQAGDSSAAGEYVPTSVDGVLAGAKDVRIAVARGLSIDGRVVDAAGNPALGGLVQALGPKESPSTKGIATRSVRIGRDGSFRLPGLATGSYELIATSRGADGSDLAPIKATDVQAGAHDVVLRTETGQVIAGRLLLEDGSPLPRGPGSVQFRWKTAEGATSWQDIPMMWAADGSFRSNALEPGRLYDVVVSDIPGRMGGAVRGVPLGTTDVVVTVRDGARIAGRVLDASGAPVPAGVPVALNSHGDAAWPREPGRSGFARTAADGRFVVTGLDDRPFRFSAGGEPSDFIGATLPENVQPGATDVEIRLERGVSISGRLVDAKGVALKAGCVQATRQGYPISVNGKGEFVLRALRPGTYRLFAQIGQRIVDVGEYQAPADGIVVTVRDE